MIPRVRVLGVRRRSGRFVRLAIVPVLLSLVAGCGGGGSSSGGGGVSSPTITSVSVTCAITTVAVGKASQCSATVTGTGNYSSAVTWAVNGTTGGNATYGSISANGLYQTPATVPAPATIQISATSVQDSTKSNSTQILAVLSIAIAPLTPSIQLFHSQQFSATVQGVSNTAVTWSVNGISGGNSAVGQISTNGLYSPPAVLLSRHGHCLCNQSGRFDPVRVNDSYPGRRHDGFERCFGFAYEQCDRSAIADGSIYRVQQST